MHLDESTAQKRADERVAGFLKLLRSAPCTGEELHMLVMRTAPEDLQAFLRAIQRALERRR